jgi:hypothetical protein
MTKFDDNMSKEREEYRATWPRLRAAARLRGCLLGNQTRDVVAVFSLEPLAQARLARLPMKKPRRWGLGLVFKYTFWRGGLMSNCQAVLTCLSQKFKN